MAYNIRIPVQILSIKQACFETVTYFKSRDRPIIGYTDHLNRYRFRYRLIGIGIPHIGIGIIGIGNGKNLRAGNRLD